jgi:sugar lactone lactonase YvrE
MAGTQLLVGDLGFPEGPRWHGGRLWFSDFAYRTVRTVGLAGDVETVAELDDIPSGIGFHPDGTPLVVSLGLKRLLRLGGDRPQLFADLASVAGDFLNDMVVDGDGNAYVGTRTRAMRPSWSALPATQAVDTLVLVDHEGHARTVALGLISPNGTVITPDGARLIVAETYAHRISVFDRRPDGSLHRRRTFAEVPGEFPDGITSDAEGAVWFGSPYTNHFVRVREGGEVTDVLELPGAVACMLGGDDRRTLFLLGVDGSMTPVPDGHEGPRPAGRPSDGRPRRAGRPQDVDGPTPPPPTGGHIWTAAAPAAGAGWP